MSNKPFNRDDVASLIKHLEEQGYDVRKKARYIKKTFDVNLELLADFNAVRGDISIRDAFNEALALWLEWKKTNSPK